MDHRTQGDTLFALPGLLQQIQKAQPLDKVHRTRSRRVLSSGASVLLEFGGTPLLAYGDILQPEIPLNCIVGVLTEVSLHGCD